MDSKLDSEMDSELNNIHVDCCEPVAKKTKAEKAAAAAQAKFERRTQSQLSKAAANLLQSLGYTIPDVSVYKEEPDFKQGLSLHIDELPLTPGIVAKYRINDGTDKWWILESKVVFSDAQLSVADLDAVAAIAVRFAPPGSTVSLQADTHGAGNVFVGMIMSVDVTGCKIPVNLVSGDIGCGLSVIPLVTPGPQQKSREDFGETMRDYCSYVVATMRRTLLRGKAAESGAFLATNVMEAAAFYGFDELATWLDEMRTVMDAVGIMFASYERSELDKLGGDRESAKKLIPIPPGLSYEQAVVLRYISRYAQSLGSSGNHFCELSQDDGNKLWLVVHSGSRGLGAAVYNVIAEACRFMEGGYEVATGALAVFYQRAFDTLCKFAKLNRVLCALAVLQELGYETNARVLQDIMIASPLFQHAVGRFKDARTPTLALLGGLVHNGISCFVNDDTRTVFFVLKKGAIAMTRRAAASIVALRAGEGCLMWTMADPSCATYETTMAEGSRLIREGFTQVYESPDVLFAGHGAGRARPTSKTARLSTFDDVVAFHDAQGMVGNIAPGLLGDNPAIAYNDVEVVQRALPLDEACTRSQLKTLVAFKEGICHMPRDNEACAAFIQRVWSSSRPDQKLTYDLNLCRRVLGEAQYAVLAAERDAVYEEFKARF